MERKLINMSKQIAKLLDARLVQLKKEYEALRPYRNVVMSTAHVTGTGRTYFYAKNGKTRKYLGREGSDDVVRIKRARYVEKAITILENDLRLLDKLAKGYKFTDFEDINLMIPKTYRPEAYDYYENLPDVAKKWLEEKEAEKASFGPWYPEDLIHRVSNGLMVRTKSEMAIAEILLRNGIPFVYELPHVLKNGRIVHTDFTILSIVDYKTEYLLEHEGSMEEQGYRRKHSWRIENYFLSGYVPNVNIFFTFDGVDGSIDGESVQRIIDGWFKPA